MAYQRTKYDDQHLGELLSAAGRTDAFPPTPDLTAIVRARIEPTPVWYERAWATVQRHPAVASLVAAVLAVVVSISAFTDAPGAVADRFGVPGIQITFESPDEDPALTPVAPSGLELGEAMTLEEARSRATFDVRVPTEGSIGQPDNVFVGLLGDVPLVSLAYKSGDELYPANATGLGLLVTQFPAELADEPFIVKSLSPDSVATEVEVNGDREFWLDGGRHSFRYETPDGEPGTEQTRLAGNVLLWEEDGYVFRIEGSRSLSLETALAIAESMSGE